MSRTAEAPVPADRAVLGIVLMIGFALVAPVMDAFAKATPPEVPVAQLLLARFGIQAALLVPVALVMGLSPWCGARMLGRHMLRALTLLVATGLFFAALRAMPISNAIAIFFVAPLITTLAGGVFLNEPVGPRRILACLAGFGGALLVIRPSFADLGLVALFPLGTAACFSAYLLMTRAMARGVPPVALQLHTALAATVLVAPVLIVFNGSGVVPLDPVWPRGFAVWTLLGVGTVATVSHLFLAYALKFAPAATIAPLQYLEIVGATIIGYYAFGDFPQPLTWAGITIIVGSGLYVFAREQAQEAADRRRFADSRKGV